jgi:hypothetical protein
MRPEYKRSDLGPLVRGKYTQRLRESANVVVIEPDLAKAFPNARAVNMALRRLFRDDGASGRGVRGETATRAREGINIVLIDPHVHAAFPTADAVNKALRAILDAVPARRPKHRRR